MGNGSTIIEVGGTITGEHGVGVDKLAYMPLIFGPDDLAPLFPMELIKQEVSTEGFVDIPGAVLDVYKTYRPSPLIALL